MRRTVVALSALATVLLGAVPAASADSDTGAGAGKGWEPTPSKPWDVPAGLRCDFPVHGEPVVDEVVRHVLDTDPDGSAKRVSYKGDLVVRVTNTDTGAFYDADVSGRAIVEYRTDGSQFWSVRGPVLVGFGENGGTLLRGLYTIDGVYTMNISATGYKTVTMAHGTSDDLCARIG
ncbi:MULTISPECIES: hypothetical protein [unclassified Streptomyces]|uniref:hypothetical protein n=1 Tax=unclassified Streptomyces TaxID=2593676 RepID=UPI002DDAAFA3|nr:MULTISPECIES: hypothetical protein [unclassified Streptomyces]WSF84845.1 hypothetical protein OIE70_18155 [Streptomyces sp. NBC_01744]WSC38864.1 hypothetical protein OHA08_27035 [Streptomyces sp. NBC_01763]WSC47006.1 hypothetical protein OIE61_25300 [Streptomyces sp. NBC_01762]WSD26659.1 hypothetical protein OHA26_26000 [Streptomyces sp. NBC_01751]WSJ51413.1 hypothetical protein OG243_18770 [Streptomyces sp. NBC_01318]